MDPEPTPPPDPAAVAEAPPDGDERSSEWLTEKERGNLRVMRWSFALARAVGRTPMKVVVTLVALWYSLVDRRARAASRGYLDRVLGRRARWTDLFRHFHTFAQVTLDRVFLLSGATRGIRFERYGREHLTRQLETGQGAVLLGAHVGSYEALRADGAEQAFPISILGYFENASMINALLEELDPGQTARVVHLGEDPVGAMARVRGRVEDGELVALMGDRVGLNDRTVRVDFLGAPAEFPTGSFHLARLLHCPVFLVFGIYRAPGTYEIHCEPFSDGIELPRRDREARLAALVKRYAERVEHHVRRSPYNWFNFYDFWKAE